jgi:hypothetical protein
MTASPSAKIIEEQNAAETNLSATLTAAEWANMLRRFRGGPHSVRLFWMSVGSIEGQLTTRREKVTDELEEVLAQQGMVCRVTQSSVIIKLTNPAENTQLHISFEEKALAATSIGRRQISPFPPPYPYAQSMAVAVPPAAVPVPPAPFIPPQASR